jgi:serine phosphatase RsbU (regulator of sigma subunit)
MKIFYRFLYNFLSSRIRGSLIFQNVRRVTLINIFALSGIFYLSFYSVKMFYLNEPNLSLIYIFCICIIVSMMFYLRFKKAINFVSHILVAGLMGIELFFLFRNGSHLLNISSYYIFPGIYWYYIFPPFSIFLMGRKVGALYNLVLISFTIIFFSFSVFDNNLYDLEFKVRFLSVYSAIFFFAFFFEYIRSITFQAFQITQEKKIKLLSRVSLQKDELVKKSVELSWMTEEIRVQMEYLDDMSKEISEQRDLLLQQKQNITDSILYASYIQKALLPNESLIKNYFNDHFILYKPRDIIGGDFYYLKKIENTFIFAVADCTGHGVPGALLSMLGIAFLTEITHQREITETRIVLSEVRERIKSALDQNYVKYEARGGMDIALCALNLDNHMLQFSGINLPIYIIRESELITLKSNKMPVGIILNDNVEFLQTDFQLIKGDTIYLFSDGYEDQFGGEANRKFMTKSFQELLLKISPKKMSEQKTILKQTLNDWMGTNNQTDDILVVGLRI